MLPLTREPQKKERAMFTAVFARALSEQIQQAGYGAITAQALISEFSTACRKDHGGGRGTLIVTIGGEMGYVLAKPGKAKPSRSIRSPPLPGARRRRAAYRQNRRCSGSAGQRLTNIQRRPATSWPQLSLRATLTPSPSAPN